MTSSVSPLQQVRSTSRTPRFCSWSEFHLRTLGASALHTAAWDGNLAIMQFVLEVGQDPDTRDDDGAMTPMMVAILRLNLMTMRSVFRDGQAVRRNVVVDLQLFLNHHQCVTSPQRLDFGEAVLLLAVDRQLEEVVRFIVENAYASVTARNAAGETPLHRAILCRSPALMELLVSLNPAGDCLTTITEDMETPAHYPARFGSDKEMEMLLQCLVSEFGDLQELGTASPLAFVNKSVSSLKVRDSKVQLLLRHGAPLFPIGLLADELSPADSNLLRIRFPIDVQHCLQIWLVEDKAQPDEPEDEEISQNASGAVSAESFAELCVKWVTSVACANSWTLLLHILICAGYCHEIVPLLVDLPLQRSALPALLRQLKKFAGHQLFRSLLLQLHDEVLVAVTTLRTERI